MKREIDGFFIWQGGGAYRKRYGSNKQHRQKEKNDCLRGSIPVGYSTSA